GTAEGSRAREPERSPRFSPRAFASARGCRKPGGQDAAPFRGGMREHLRSYLHFLRLEKNAAPNTIESYTLDLNRYLGFLERKGLKEIGDVRERDVTAFVTMLGKTGLSPRSVSRSLSSIKMFHKFLAGEKLSPGDPARLADSPKLSRTLPDV